MVVYSYCSEFEKDLRINWKKPDGQRVYFFATDSLILNFKSRYKNCLLGKDSSYLLNRLGRKYSWISPLCYDSTKKNMNLEYGIEYIIQTPKRDGSYSNLCGYSVVFSMDSSNTVRCITIQDFNCIGYK